MSITTRPVRVAGTLFSLALMAGALSAQLPGTLVDVTVSGQPDYSNISHFYFPTGSPFPDYTEMGGASVGDYNDDGLQDLFLPNNLERRNKLYENQGDGTFMDVALEKGVGDPVTPSSSALFIDYDNDGDLDLFVFGHAGKDGVPAGPLYKVFRNRGASGEYKFRDVTEQAGFAFSATVKGTDSGWHGGAAAGDYDRDGYLDLFVTYWQGNTSNDMWRLFRSEPNPAPGDPLDPTYSPRIFVDHTIEAGLDFLFDGEPWQPAWFDANRDGWPDLHVNMDFGMDYMFMNNQDETFTEVATPVGLNGIPPSTRNEMGIALGDIDFDGDLDMHLTNLLFADRLYRNDTVDGSLSFVDTATESLLYDSPWGWGTSFFDYDLDGDLDHAAVSGFKLPSINPYYNTFHINKFPEMHPDGITVKWDNEQASVPQYSKVDTPAGDAARGLTWLDYDNDGDPDLVVTRHQATTALYKNTQDTGNNWIQVDLVNRGGSLNTAGAQVWLRSGDYTQYREIIVGSSFLCQEPTRMSFGLGTNDADWMVIRWPTGHVQIVSTLDENAVNTVAWSATHDLGDLTLDGLILISPNNPVLSALLQQIQTQVGTPGGTHLLDGTQQGAGKGRSRGVSGATGSAKN